MTDGSERDTSSPDIQMPEEPNSVGGSPSASGMMTPQAPEGDIEAAKLDAYHAMRLIDRSIAKFGRKSEFADGLMKARAALTSLIGEHEEDSERFSDAEIKRMLLTLAGPSQPQAPSNPGAQQQGGKGGQQMQQQQGQMG